MDPFFQGFITELSEAGNQVLLIRTNDFINTFDIKKWHTGIDKDALVETVKRFSPQLIIAPNHSIPDALLQCTDCPILIYSADAPAHYASPDVIRENVDRYTFLHHWDQTFGDVCVKNFGCAREQNIHTGYYTAIKSAESEIKNNLVFIGSLGWPQIIRSRFQELTSQEELTALLAEFDEKTQVKEKWDTNFLHLLTFSERVRTLDCICDLGLKIYGWPYNLLEAVPYSIGIARCFDFTPVFTLEKTEEILNQTLIAPTLPNAQAPDGLSWRCVDVMASSACLISPPKKDLKRISPYVEIPTYQSALECRELCKKLLADEAWRREVVEGSHKAVEEHCRFTHLFKKLEAHFGLPLTSQEKGSITRAEALYPVPHNFIFRIKQTPAYKRWQKTMSFKIAKKIYRSIWP